MQMPKIQMRRDTAANWKSVNPILLAGEWALETDTRLMKIGDGTTAYNALPYSTAEDSDEWQKPADWVDIQSGAITNSVTLLVAHSLPTESEGVYTVETYPQFHILAQVSTSGNTYDVFVDGLKVATTATSTKTVLDWATLYGNGTVSTIYTTTHPSPLVYHVVRIAPTVSTDTLTQFRNNVDSSNTQQGILWAHFELSNAIRIYNAFGGETRPRNSLLEAVTAKDNKITYTVASSASGSGFYGTFSCCSSLVQIPVLQAENTTYDSGTYVSFWTVPAKKVVIKGNKGTETLGFLRSTRVENFDIENGVALSSATTTWGSATDATKLKKLPKLNVASSENLIANTLTSLEPTVIDDSYNSARKLLRFYGASGKMVALQGLTVSNAAPFDGASPQINISYTDMSRAALVQLFKSMPYNVGYTVVGSPTIVDGIASGFSSSNTIQINNFNAGSESWEFVTRAKRSSGGGNAVLCIGNGQPMYIYFSSSTLRVSITGTNTDISGTFDTNVFYYIRVRKEQNTFYLDYSTDRITYIGTISTTADLSSYTSNSISFGRAPYYQTTYFGGSIDLNETYIKVNGVPWFTGKATMTKTCNIVGCTGTADLTAKDKNIALDKGWELTVA